MGSTLNSLIYGQARNLITTEISLLRTAIIHIDEAIRCNNTGMNKAEADAIEEANRYIKQAHHIDGKIKILGK